MEKKSRFEGCLIGGAVGDALGWPVEFLKLDEIKKKFGDHSVYRSRMEAFHTTIFH